MKIWDKLGFYCGDKVGQSAESAGPSSAFPQAGNKHISEPHNPPDRDDEDENKVRPALSLSVVPPGSEGLRNLDHPKEVLETAPRHLDRTCADFS